MRNIICIIEFVLALLFVVVTFPYVAFKIIKIAIRRIRLKNRFSNRDELYEYIMSFGIIPDDVRLIIANKGNVGCPTEACARDGLIVLNYQKFRLYDDKIIIKTLKHEMVHVMQFRNGYLSYNFKEKKASWKGETKSFTEWYDVKPAENANDFIGVIKVCHHNIMMKTKYFFLPWEQQAYGYDVSLSNKIDVWNNLLLNAHVLIVRQIIRFTKFKLGIPLKK